VTWRGLSKGVRRRGGCNKKNMKQATDSREHTKRIITSARETGSVDVMLCI